MHIDWLHYIAWGSFTDRRLDFGTGPGGFTLIYGDNGAGKTTAHRGLLGLLFGIPHSTPYAHLHKNSELRIGAGISDIGGRQLEFVRRKGKKDTLLDLTNAPLSEADLERFLPGLARPTFQTTFALDNDSLRKGGELLTTGEDDLASSLFGAALGPEVQQVLKELEVASDEIWRPRGKKQHLNAAIRRFKEAQQASKRLTLRTDDYLRAEEDLKQGRAQVTELSRQLGKLKTQEETLVRIRDLAPRVAQLRALEGNREQLGEVVLLDEQAGAQRTEAEKTLRDAEAAVQTLEGRSARVQDQLAALDVPQALLDEAAAITGLIEQVGARDKAREDRKSLEGKMLQSRGLALATLERLGWGDKLEEGRERVPGTQLSSRIQQLIRQCPQLEASRSAAHEQVETRQDEVEQLTERLERLGEPCDTHLLEALTQEGLEQGLVSQQRAKLGSERADLAARIDSDLQTHRPFSGGPEALLSLSTPAREAIERHAGRWAELDQQARELEQQVAGAERALDDAAREGQALQREGELTTEEALMESRTHRDEGWALIKEAWQGKSTDTRPLEAWASDKALDAAYEGAVERADSLADILRSEADRTAHYQQLLVTQEKAKKERGEALEGLRALEATEAREKQNWRDEWTPAGFSPLPPSEMLAWLLRHEALKDKVLRLNTLDREIAQLEATEQRLTEALQRQLGPPDDSTAEASLAALLGRAGTLLDEARSRSHQREQLQERIAELGKQLKVTRRDREKSDQAMLHWQEEWGAALKGAGFPRTSRPAEAEQLLAEAATFLSHADDVARREHRIQAIDRDQAEFVQEIEQLAARSGRGPLGEQGPEDFARTLALQLEQATRSSDKQTTWQERLEEWQEDLEDLHERQARARATLSDLVKAAQVETADDLPQAEKRSDQVREINRSREELRKQILEGGGGRSLEDLLQEVEAADLDSLVGRIQDLSQEQKDVQLSLGEANQHVGRLTTELEAMDTRGQAAEQAELAQAETARIQDLTESYTLNRIAARVLRHGIDRFREDNQGPLLQRGAQLFQKLTLGRFEGLVTDFGEDDQPVLRCVRDEGQALSPQELSEGEADQLYLALRVASVERFLEERSPSPFVLDDILTSFDDDRAAAGLAVLGELAKQTQVLFFTHHQRLAELARKVIDGESLTEITL